MLLHLLCLLATIIPQVTALFNIFNYAAYAPGLASCPSSNLVRPASSGISSSESAWLQKRHAKTNPALISFSQGLNLDNFDASSFVNGASSPINIGLSFSGGGYRAMLAGAGQLAAYDSRTSGSDPGLKGLLQASTYLVGLSGGSWMVGTVTMNNFMSVEDVVNSDSLWDLDHSIIDPGFINPFTNLPYYIGINSALLAKTVAGYEVTVVDVWSRALSHQFLPAYSGDGAGLRFSSLAEGSTAFATADQPFPVMSALTRAPNTGAITLASTSIEFNPYELGSWDPTLAAFAQMKYVGSSLNNGKIQPWRTCVTGFDNAGFVMGTSSAVFTSLYSSLNLSAFPSLIQKIINAAVVVPYQNLNVVLASWTPNPFYSSTSSGFLQSNSKLWMTDGGIDGQNIPLQPLLQKNRHVDVIFAHDNSADIDGWPNGSAMIATYNRQFTDMGSKNGSSMPKVPDQNTFRNGNLTTRPAFFGCNVLNSDTPLIVYLANRPFSYWSNTSTYKLTYSETAKRGMIRNGYETVSRNNGTLDSSWNKCVGCAIISKEQARKGIAQSDQCKKCFAKYCWDGSIYSGPSRGENFGSTSLSQSASQFNSNNVGGINDGGISILKRDENELGVAGEESLLDTGKMYSM